MSLLRPTSWSLAVLLCLLAGCGGDSDPASADVLTDVVALGDTQPDAHDAEIEVNEGDAALPDVPIGTLEEQLNRGPFKVGSFEADLVDETRPTQANGSFEGSDSRELRTIVFYPAQEDEETPAAEGPFPLLVYSHGFMSNRFDNRGLCEHLTRQGFVVVSADFPLTRRGAPGGENVLDIEFQPADVSFLIDTLLGDTGLVTDGLVDGERIGAFGVSLGAMTSLMLGYHEEYGDPRIDAVVAAAPPTCFAPAEMLSSGLPLLMVHGDNDSILPYEENAAAAYDLVAAPKFFATIHGGNHANFPDAGLIMEALENSDQIGCDAIVSNIPSGDMGDLAEAIGGRSADEVNATCSVPCEGIDDAPPAIAPSIQHDILNAGTTAFFNYTLRGDESGLGFLIRGYDDAFSDDLTFRFELE